MTAKASRAAVFIDFEGRKDQHPVLLGVLICGESSSQFTQHIIDHRFKPLATLRESTCASTLVEALETIPPDLPVFAWSKHESAVLTSLASGSSVILGMASRVRDAIEVARPWARTQAPAWSPVSTRFRGRHTLDQYMKRVGYQVPTVHGPMNTGKRLAETAVLLDRGKPYEAWTPTQKSKWTNVLEHNRHDCYGMQAVLERIWSSAPQER